MARVRRLVAPVIGGVPEALGSRDHPAWEDAREVVALSAAFGLAVRCPRGESLQEAPAWARFEAFREAWCVANGFMHPRWAELIDYRRAREAGIDTSSSSRSRLRRAR